jgi:hypothetical protein
LLQRNVKADFVQNVTAKNVKTTVCLHRNMFLLPATNGAPPFASKWTAHFLSEDNLKEDEL